MTVGSNRFASMRMPLLTRVEMMAWRVVDTTDVSTFLKVEDFTVYNNIFWGFQVKVFSVIGKVCSAESKDIKVPGKWMTRAVPHREIHIIIGSFVTSHSSHSLHLVNSERDKITVLCFLLLKG